VTELEPTPEKPNNRVLDDTIMAEIRRVEDCYKRGERAYTIAKACKKDEVLPVAKGKCRIFYGNPIALTFLVRKYFLPVLRFLQMNPLVSECAVGINCHGPEWNEFYKHATHFGKDRLFGGDYGKYDQKLPSQLLLAAIRILTDISEAMGYSKADRDVMSAMAGDLVFSLIAFNGDLVGLQSGTHISGNSLTVILNGICGSLNLRNFFYTKYSSDIDFRSAAHMMTYGDDNIGSVSPDYPEFNIKGCSEFLATYGQVYTMPDKESELTEYLDPSEFEFLKRFSVYHPRLGVSTGALLEKSIFKSLHCYMRPKGCPLTPEEACAQNIDTALREWFNHGEEVYEKRRAQMREIAKEAGISHMCTQLHENYSDCVSDWHCKYSGVEKEHEEHTFDRQSGVEPANDPQYVQAIADVPVKLMAVDLPLMDFGELDLVFMTTIHGRHYYIIVEVKKSANPQLKKKAKKQIGRWLPALAILRPDCSILGATYIGGVWNIAGEISHSWTDFSLLCVGDTPFTRAVALYIL
jgi:hypothetical protein